MRKALKIPTISISHSKGLHSVIDMQALLKGFCTVRHNRERSLRSTGVCLKGFLDCILRRDSGCVVAATAA